MRKMRCLLAAALCLLLCLSLLPAAAAEEENAILGSGMCGAEYYDAYGVLKRYDVWWTLNSDGTMTVTGTGKMGWSDSCPWADYRDRILRVQIGSGVTLIRGFEQCPALTTVTIPATVTALWDSCFAGCASLTEITLPGGITEIPANCFCGCSAMKSAELPSGVTEIGWYAFGYCGSLSALKLPTELKTIGAAAFAGCGSLTELTIPAKVTSIGQRAFLDCVSLSAIRVSSSNERYAASNGVLFNKDKSELIAYPCGKSGDYKMPSTVTAISPYAFAGCQKLGHITVGSKVTVIPVSCFEEACLSVVTLPASLKEIGEGAFQLCEGLSSITFPASLESMGDWAFWACGDLREIYFKGPAPTIGDFVFSSVGEDGAHAAVCYPAAAAGWEEASAGDWGSEYLDWIACVKPTVTLQPRKASAYPGETVEYRVAADAEVSFQWYYRKTADGEWIACSGEDARTDTLRVEAKAYRSGYQYRCKLTNYLGSATSWYASLTVLEPKITAQPKSLTAATGGTAGFTVKAEGAASFRWYFSKDGGATWTKCSDGTGAALTVEAKAYRSGYLYRCAVKNAVGTVYSKAAALTVLDPPTVRTQPKDRTAAPGETVSFTLKASGTDLNYQWYFSKDGGASWTKCTDGTGAALTVEAKSYRNGYLYRCKISNAVGSVYSEAAALNVAKP